jgi:hypothetical protein
VCIAFDHRVMPTPIGAKSNVMVVPRVRERLAA